MYWEEICEDCGYKNAYSCERVMSVRSKVYHLIKCKCEE